MTTTNSVPVIEGLFAETSEGPRLLGCRCTTCGTLYFPRSTACHNPDCRESKLEEASFGPKGKLYSCAVQNYPPPAPVKYARSVRADSSARVQVCTALTT